MGGAIPDWSSGPRSDARLLAAVAGRHEASLNERMSVFAMTETLQPKYNHNRERVKPDAKKISVIKQ
jgi:hypothetical protein